jgi:hypothetical protein
MRWRRVGAPDWTNAVPFEVPGKATNATWSQSATGLEADADYEYQVCGKEASMNTYVCAGPDGANSTQQFTASETSSAAPGWFGSHSESQQRAIVDFFYATSPQGTLPYSGTAAITGLRMANEAAAGGGVTNAKTRATLVAASPFSDFLTTAFLSEVVIGMTEAGLILAFPEAAPEIAAVAGGARTLDLTIEFTHLVNDGETERRVMRVGAPNAFEGGSLHYDQLVWEPYGKCIFACRADLKPWATVQQWPGAYLYHALDFGGDPVTSIEPPCDPSNQHVGPAGSRLQTGLAIGTTCGSNANGPIQDIIDYPFMLPSDFTVEAPLHPYDPATDPAPDKVVEVPSDRGVGTTRPKLQSSLESNDQELLRGWIDWQLEPERQDEEIPLAIGLPPQPKQTDSCVAASTPDRRDPGKKPPNFSSGDPRAQLRRSFTGVYNPLSGATQSAKLYWGSQQGFGERHIQSDHGWGTNDITQTQSALSQPDARVPDPLTNTTWRYYKFFTGSNGTTHCTRRVVVNFGTSDDNFSGTKDVITSFAYPTTSADPAPGTFR